MKIVCVGGGPAGLYFALLMKTLDPTHDITVVERNKPYDTFGWGVRLLRPDAREHAPLRRRHGGRDRGIASSTGTTSNWISRAASSAAAATASSASAASGS